ncbi:MAG: AAA family ATPase, partial [Bacteroides sp.]|nr:AAA family ATPase [Bacteroides sp.]
LVQFHPSYAYEDFVRGMVVEASDAGTPQYKTIDKTLGEFARKAARNWQLHLLSGANHLQEVVEQKNRWEQFIEFVQRQIDEQGRFPLTPHVYLSEYDDTRFTYKGDNWNAHPNGLNMKYAELQRIAEAGVTERAQVKNVPGIAPLTRTHATYFTRMMQLYQEFRPQPAQAAPVEKVELESYVLIIDEINRANLPVVLGELIYTLEYRGESVESMYAIEGDNSLVLPPNLYIIGTMNTADRSVGQIDYAIRRRFAFIDMLPELLEVSGFDTALFTQVSSLFIKNVEEYRKNRNCRLQRADCLSEEFRPEDVWIGHSYFLMKDKAGRDLTDMRLRYEIVPILREYLKDGIFKDTEEVEDKIHEWLRPSLPSV